MSALSWLDDNDDFNPEEAAEDAQNGDFKPVPPGEYELEVISAEEKEIDNDRGEGLRVSVQFAIRGEKYDNRRVWDSFNVLYKSKRSDEESKEKAATTQRIGRGQFGALCVALGISKRPGSYDELVGKFCRGKLGTEEWKGEKRNNVKSYSESTEFTNASRPKASNGSNPWT